MGDAQKTVVKGLSFSGVTEDGNTVQVDVKDGKIVRIRPFHFDWKYDVKPWKIEARGTVFEASTKVLIPPFTLAYKNRINSPNRTMYPLKRVDWPPISLPLRFGGSSARMDRLVSFSRPTVTARARQSTPRTDAAVN